MSRTARIVLLLVAFYAFIISALIVSKYVEADEEPVNCLIIVPPPSPFVRS